MGRFRPDFAGRHISLRIPYSMSGELTVENGVTGFQFPDATFLTSIDKPFEVHSVTCRLSPMDGDDVILPPAFYAAIPNLDQVLQKYTRVRIRDFSKNENMTKASQLLGTLMADNTMQWAWEDPYVLVRSEGFEVTCDNNLTDFTVTVGAATETVEALRFEVCFMGYLLVIAPASEQR